ncbi:PREDICTED: uncharacterized protein LOC108776788 [Cyphomyrmex costatus]|uniref:uncharacterized protein LOC108776788 n=1 Tax=Cyphomyrmex costatus TaxID=456900 RepID=UPI0008521E7D|nr:PREDICTED: uncharacterized protein LOC108776788 [Cyphomyrmex costatus]
MNSSETECEVDENEESSSNESAVRCKRAKKKKYLQKYNSNWETEAEYKEWLGPNKNNIHEAICRICNKSINISAGKNQLKRHKARTSHIKAISVRKYQPSMTSLIKVQSLNSMELSTKKADLYFAAFVAEHNVPFKIMEHMPQLIKQICVDSEIAKNIACSRTKVTAIVQNVIGQYNLEQICKTLNNVKFSLIVDESTDRGCTKHLCIVVRFFQDKKVIDCFLGLIPLKDATAEDLYDKVTAFFNLNKIPYKTNLIGFASDGANVMVGTKNSFSSRLVSDIPHIFLMKCICHSFHLCASNACSMLPSSVEELTREIYNYFSNSPKRVETLKEFQKFANVKIHKILHPAQTRWLSVESVVVRILEQYEALKLFFIDASVSSDRTSAGTAKRPGNTDSRQKQHLSMLSDIDLPWKI